MQIAIDGPAGAGKSTVAKKLAQVLNCQYIDTGAMYRAVVVLANQAQINLEQKEKIEALSQDIEFLFYNQGESQRLSINGIDMTEVIRHPTVSEKVSLIAAYPGVRASLVAKQQAMAIRQDVVMEGRDIGEVVLPKADFKFFVTASIEVRAKRRADELTQKGMTVNIDQIRQNIFIRDQNDCNRTEGALKQLPDAIYVDTSDKTVDAVVAEISAIIRRVK